MAWVSLENPWEENLLARVRNMLARKTCWKREPEGLGEPEEPLGEGEEDK